ncbi:MAG: hypothetical protein IJK52_12900 [Oscillospiraceae bacterium]|nr:hypothetical protein [Oscillospiraceae bacterium]
MNAIILRLECLTNLHVGNGDVNYNIIDNEVERDPLTRYPVIHASGVKGALREYFERNGLPDINALFGKEAGADGDKNTSPGKLKILSAEMLAIPVRASAGDKPYYLVSTETAVKRYCRLKEEFLGVETLFTPQSVSGVKVDGLTPESKVTVDGQALYLLSDADFAKIALPVLARNCLDDGGISQNLWYEEVVPHESLFFFPVLSDKLDYEFLTRFRDAVKGNIVQFGGNASIGYGLCKVTVLEGVKHE